MVLSHQWTTLPAKNVFRAFHVLFLEEVEKFCYLGDIFSSGDAFEAVSAKIGSVWKKFRELSDVLVGKQGLSLEQLGKIYQCCV